MKLRFPVPALLAAALVLSACATLKPPTLAVDSLKVGKMRVTGLGLNVGFNVRNPNPEDLLVERFEYELQLNGERLGRGYYPNAIRLPGFGSERVVSQFDLNFLAVPGTIKAIIDKDRVRARAKGKFYVREAGGGLKKVDFDADADVEVRR